MDGGTCFIRDSGCKRQSYCYHRPARDFLPNQYKHRIDRHQHLHGVQPNALHHQNQFRKQTPGKQHTIKASLEKFSTGICKRSYILSLSIFLCGLGLLCRLLLYTGKAFVTQAGRVFAGTLTQLNIPLYKAEETIKETYSDEELKKLLKKPDTKKCDFPEYRYLFNTLCPASAPLDRPPKK